MEKKLLSPNMCAALLVASMWKIRACQGAHDVFLFAGQSNMWGHSTSGQSIEGESRSLFEDSLSLSGTDLINRIDEAQREALGNEYDPNVAVRTVEALEPLKAVKVLDNVMDEMEHGFCSLNGGSEVPIQAYSNCGGEYGVELTFAHTLTNKYGGFATQSKSLYIRKAAEGGKLVTDFLPGGSEHDRLLKAIDGASDSAAYRAFVWYQGENDVFEETSTESYYENLIDLVDIVSERMYRSGKTSEKFSSPHDIPVLVFKLGFWPQTGDTRNAIDLAHEQVVASLIREGRSAALIEGGDQYSRFYHLDAPTLLILGSKLADEYMQIAGNEQDESEEDQPCGFFCLFGHLLKWLVSVFVG